MTADDKKSTSGASDTSSVMAVMVAGNLEAAAAYGLDAARLREQAGLTERDLADPDGRVPFTSYVRLLQAIDAAPGSDGFGLWLGHSVSVRSLGVVGFAMQHAPDVRAAFACLTRFRALMNDRVSPIIEETADAVVFRRVEPPSIAGLASVMVAAPVGTLTLVRELAGLPEGSALATGAAFQHPPPANVARYRELLRCPIEFDAAETRVALRRELFDLPLCRPDPNLFEYLTRHARALEARLRDAASLADQLREALSQLLPEGEPEQAAFARRLGMSERTLQRRLQKEGTSFAALLDAARAELARSYLSDSKLAVFEVAYLLGYSEPSAFNRAFRRWTGQSPREYRDA